VYREEEREMIPLCLSEGIGYTPYSPLARGFLAGKGGSARAKHDPFIAKFHGNETDAAIRSRVDQLAKNLNTTAGKVALAWLLHQPVVTAPVIGATSIAHVEDAVAALELKLSPQDLAFLQEPYRPRQVLLHL
jgi:aryl-alcohol dehydrogenase-like predicted oxidoreductase